MDFIGMLSIFLPGLAFVCILLILFVNLYQKMRLHYKIKVNCWFCNQWTRVLYEMKNSWTCPFCEQYNGFNKNGDYNKPIPAQHDELMNKLLTPLSTSKTNAIRDNGLCNICNNNQQLKIHQLSVFSPLYENRFDEEIEQYERQLERAYQLCPQCEITVKHTLDKQKSFLLNFRLTTLKKQGFDYFNINNSHLNIFKTNSKRQIFLTAANYILILIIAIRIIDTVKMYDFSYKSLPNAILITRDFINNYCNVVLLIFEYLQYLQLIIYEQFVMIPYFNFIYLEIFSFIKMIEINYSVVLNCIGLILQLIMLVLRKTRIVDSVKLFGWILLLAHGLDQTQSIYKQLNISSGIIEVVLCCFLAFVKSPKSINMKMKKNCMNKLDETDQSSSSLLNSTFAANDVLSFNSSKLSNPVSTSTPPKLLNVSSKPVDGFGREPIFENLLTKSYHQFRSESRNDISEKLNDTLTTQSEMDLYDLKSSENELNKGLSDLHLSSISLSPKQKSRPIDMPPVFRVASPIQRPKPILSPSRLQNATQSSWTAGGYWKTTPDLFTGTNLSRSSSQSSGFGSQTSSQQPHFENVFNSLPSSRNNSVCGEFDRFSVLSEPPYHCCSTNRFYPIVKSNQPAYIFPNSKTNHTEPVWYAGNNTFTLLNKSGMNTNPFNPNLCFVYNQNGSFIDIDNSFCTALSPNPSVFGSNFVKK